MQDYLEKFEDFLTEDGEMTTKEFTLTVLCAFLIGLVLGMIFSPKRSLTIGCNNHDNGNNCNAKLGDDDSYLEEIEIEEFDDDEE